MSGIRSKDSNIFKLTTTIVILLFLWNQISWAADTSNYSIDNALERQDAEQTTSFAPDYIQTQQSIHESLISQKQEIEDFNYNYNTVSTAEGTATTDAAALELQGPVSGGDETTTYTAAATQDAAGSGTEPAIDNTILSITTQDGDVINYKGGNIDSIEKKDGTIIRNIMLAANGDLLDADIEYTDGTIQEVRLGKVTRITKPDGTVFEYSDTVTAPDGSNFVYKNGELTTKVTYPDPNNPNGIVVEYFYTVDANGDIVETKLKDPEKSSYYDSQGRLKRVEFNTGKIIEYDKDKNDDTDNGILSKVIDENGKIYLYDKTEVAGDNGPEYLVSLKTIEDNGVKYHIENGDIVSIELPDGDLISVFELDENGYLVNGRVLYTDRVEILIENRRIKEINDNGTITAYAYTLDEFGEITACDITVTTGNDSKQYRYIKDSISGKLTIESANGSYEYDALEKLQKYTAAAGVFEHQYDASGLYAGSTYVSNDGTVQLFDIDKSLTETTLPDETVYNYYESGEFIGKVKEAILPDGRVISYSYRINDAGNLLVYKRFLYDYNNTNQSFYSSNAIDYTLNPTLKSTFKLDGSKNYTSINAKASYYYYNQKSINLSLNVYGNTPYIYYDKYDYVTKATTRDNKWLNMTINKDTEYTLEYEWTEVGVDIYLYETSSGRPVTPAYTLSEREWNPRFSVSGSNANIILDPASSVEYRWGRSIRTDYQNLLTGSPLHRTEFSIDSSASYKSFFYHVYGYAVKGYDSIYLNCSNGSASLYVFRFDATTSTSKGESIPINFTVNDDIDYVIETEIEESTLRLYIYEKGTERQEAVYTLYGVTCDPNISANVNGGYVTAEAYDNSEKYEYDSGSGRLIKYTKTTVNKTISYLYDQNGLISYKEVTEPDGTKKVYDNENRLVREEGYHRDITIYQYNDDGNLISVIPEFTQDTILSYYETGEFAGKVKKAIFLDGKEILFSYKTSDTGNVLVYKRFSYDYSSISQSYYSNSSIDYTLNPTLKSTFNLDSSKNYPYVNATASYYEYNDKSINLYLNVYGNTPSLYYYKYDYVTKTTTRDSKRLNMTISKDTEYTLEYEWTESGIDIYLYETSSGKPATPIYTLSEKEWNPKFSVSGNDANITIDSVSSGEYGWSKDIRTDREKPLTGSPLHRTEFSFDSKALNKYLDYKIKGFSDTEYNSISVECYKGNASGSVYRYDSATGAITNESLYLTNVFKDNTDYIIETELEEGTLKLYIYEKGLERGEAVYTMHDVTWDPDISAKIKGGQIKVEAYGDAGIYEYNTQNGILLDGDVAEDMQNKNIIIDDPYKILPDYVFSSGLPLQLPDGKTDIFKGRTFEFDYQIALPGDMFGVDGSINPLYDFVNAPYFDAITYDTGRTIKEIIKPNGDVITYEDGLVDSVLQSASTTNYTYNLSGLDNLAEIQIDRDGIKRIYDKFGDLQSLSLEDGTKIVYEDGRVSYIEKPDGTKVKNITFSDTGELFSGLVSYPDGSVAYYNDDNLLDKIESESGNIIEYSDGKIRTVTLNDGSVYGWNYEPDGTIKIHDIANEENRWYLEGRLTKVQELSGIGLTISYYYDADNRLIESRISKEEDILYTYTYTYEGELTLVHDENNNIQAYNKNRKLTYIVDSHGRKYEYTYARQNEGYVEVVMPNGSKVKYTDTGEIIEVLKSDGTLIRNIVYNADNVAQDFIYIKDGITYTVTGGKVLKTEDSDGTITEYSPEGWLKSVTTVDGSITEYEYGISDAIAPILNGVEQDTEVAEVNGKTVLQLSSYVDPSLALLLHFDETGQGDNSNSNHPMTFHGARIDTEVSKFGNSSVYFDGSEDYISIPDHDDWDFITWNEFTVDFWAKDVKGTTFFSQRENSDHAYVFYINPHFYVYNKSGNLMEIELSNLTNLNDSNWHHIALVKSGNEWGLYVDGNKVAAATGLVTGSFNANFVIGQVDNNDWYKGYIDEFRISKKALWTEDTFTPPTEEDYGRLFSASMGTLTSVPIEINAAEIKSIFWNEILPQGTDAVFRVRIGDTANPDDGTWSEWSESLTDAGGSTLDLGPAKYIQYEITLSRPDSSSSPRISLNDNNAVTINYVRVPQDTFDIASLSSVKVTKDGIVSYYDGDGKNINDSAELIDKTTLIFDSVYMDKVKAELPVYILNETQRTIYLNNDVVVAELKAITDAEGRVARYEQGEISEVEFSDGTIIKSIVLDEGGAPKDFVFVKDNRTHIVENGKLKEIITEDGTDILYDTASNFIETVKGLLGEEKTYSYIVNDAYRAISLDKFTFNNETFAYDGLSIELKVPFDYGSGTEGPLIVETNEIVYIDGTKEYESIHVKAGGRLILNAWNGSSGGLAVIKSRGPVIIEGTIDAVGKGYRGGLNNPAKDRSLGENQSGESYNGLGPEGTDPNNGGGGGGCDGQKDGNDVPNGSGGGGGGYGTVGSNGEDGYYSNLHGKGGNTYGELAFEQLYRGSGGGAGGDYPHAFPYPEGGQGGAGGGAIYITAPSITISGTVSVDGGDGSRGEGSGAGGGGGGSGGTLWLSGENVNLTPGSISAKGGRGGANFVGGGAGGSGGNGRIRVDYVELTGALPDIPTLYTQQIDTVLSGELLSEVIETNAEVYNTISWVESIPLGTQITVQTRTGDTITPDSSWSDWSTPLTISSGSQITSTPTKYMQYKVTLSSTDHTISPTLFLNGPQGIDFSYTRNPLQYNDIQKLAYIKVTEGANTSIYDASGINVDNPSDNIDVMLLAFNPDVIGGLIEDISDHRLNQAQKVITVYDKTSDVPIHTIAADHSMTYYDEGFATKVEDKNGTVLVQYTYDADKKIQKTEFIEARNKLYEGYQASLLEIATQKDGALLQLTQAEQDARENIAEEVVKIKAQIDSERQRLEIEKAKYDANIYDLSEFDRVFRELDQYEIDLYAQEAQAYADLDAKISQARQDIETDAEQAMQDLLYKDFYVALGDIAQRESSPVVYFYYRDVLGRDPDHAELEYWLNKAKDAAIGVDPGQMAGFVALDPTEIITYLQTLPEYAQRQAWKQNIINDVTTFFNSYLDATNDAEREALLAPLGLTLNDLAPSLRSTDPNASLRSASGGEAISSILTWLNSQSLHFGDSAFKTIIDLLSKEGITKTFEDIGKDAIKVDILTGVITKETTGDLVISMYAMAKAAEVNGLALYGEKIDFEELKAQYLSLRGAEGDEAIPSIILHVNGNHYVVLKEINEEDGTVTYTDLSVGADGQDITMSRAEFMEEWQGYVLSKNQIQTTESDKVKYLNESQEKNIRGSGWWQDFWKGIVNFFQKIVAPIASILLFIPGFQTIGAIALGINVMIQTISFVVRTGSLMDIVWAVGMTALPGIIGFVGNIVGSVVGAVSSIAASIFAPLQGIFQAAVALFEPITTAVTNIAKGIGYVVSLGMAQTDKVAAMIGANIIARAVNLGASIVFQSMKIDPTLNYIASALLSGLSMGMAHPDISMVAGALRFGTIAGIDLIGKAAGLDPNLAKLAAIAGGAIVGGGTHNIDGIDVGGITYASDYLARTITFQFAEELLYDGVLDIGNLLGVDDRISRLAGLAIRSSLRGSFSSGGNPFDLFLGAMTGLAQGVASIGVNYAIQELDWNPLWANMGFSAVSLGIEAAIKGTDIFKHMVGSYKENTLTMLGRNEVPDPKDSRFWAYDPVGKHPVFQKSLYDAAWGQYYWQEAVHISQMLDFSEIVKSDGLETALNSYATALFNGIAINSITNIIKIGLDKIGTRIQNMLDDFSDNPESVPEITKTLKENGVEEFRIQLKDSETGQIGLVAIVERHVDPDTGEVYFKFSGYEVPDQFGIYADNWKYDPVYNEIGAFDGYFDEYFGDLLQHQEIDALGHQSLYEVRGKDGEVLFIVKPSDDGGYNIFDSYGEYIEAEIDNRMTGVKYLYDNGNLNNVIFDKDTLQGLDNPSMQLPGGMLDSLLFSKVENGEIQVDRLAKKSIWDLLIADAEAADYLASDMGNIADTAMNTIDLGGAVDLVSLASYDEWQQVKTVASFMKNWATNTKDLFLDSITSVLAPGTKLLMDIMGDSAYRAYLKDKAISMFETFDLYEQVASVALDSTIPGGDAILDQIGVRGFWETFDSTTQFILENKNTILYSIDEVTDFMENPVLYLNNSFWNSDIGREFTRERDEFFCLTEPQTYISSIDPFTKTVKVDQDLNYGNIWGTPILGFLDVVTLLQIGNVRWNAATSDAALKAYMQLNDKIITGEIKGVSFSGVNDDGQKLDELTKRLAQNTEISFDITHSAGSEDGNQSNLMTQKHIRISPQTTRADMEQWIDTMGYSPDQVLIVDILGDLPYRPVDLLGLDLKDITDIGNIVNPASWITDSVVDLVNDKAIFDYSQNLNSKYAYIRIEGGDIGLDPVYNHRVGVDGALDLNKKYDIRVNGVLRHDVTIQEIYLEFLNGEL